MKCLVPVMGGYAEANPQPASYSECLFVLAQPSDVTASANHLSVSEGTDIAIAIITLWAIAAVFRILITQFKSNTGADTTE